MKFGKGHDEFNPIGRPQIQMKQSKSQRQMSELQEYLMHPHSSLLVAQKKHQ